MPRIIIILLVALLFEGVGVVYLKKGLVEIGSVKKIDAGELLRLIGRGATNRFILIGMFFETLFFAGLLILLAKYDVSLIWPLTSLGFVVTTLAARVLRQEEVSPMRWAGVILIVIGATIVGWSEKRPLDKPELKPESSARVSAE